MKVLNRVPRRLSEFLEGRRVSKAVFLPTVTTLQILQALLLILNLKMASEITPLLESQALRESQTTLPPLQPAIELLYLAEMTREDLYEALPAFNDYPLPSRMAFILAALLLTRARIAEELEVLHGRLNGDMHVLKIKQERALKVLQDTWDTYVCADDITSTQVSEILWTAIPLDQDSSNSIRGETDQFNVEDASV